MAPAILVTLGILFLLQEFGSWYVNFNHTCPLLLIVIGVVLLAKRSASMTGHIDPAQGFVAMQPPPQSNAIQTQPPTSEVHNG